MLDIFPTATYSLSPCHQARWTGGHCTVLGVPVIMIYLSTPVLAVYREAVLVDRGEGVFSVAWSKDVDKVSGVCDIFFLYFLNIIS